MQFSTTFITILMATVATAAAVPKVTREAPSPKAVVHKYNGAVIVSGGVPTRDFDSLSEAEKEEVLAACPAFVDGVDGEFDTACF